MSYFTKSKATKIVAGVIGFTMALSLFVGAGATSAGAQGVSLSQLVELFISLGIISADKAVQARAAVSGYTSTSSFTLDLKVGSRGTEVTNLQKALNADSRTQIASSGAGSPGNESSYFGGLTKSAVMKYQIIKGVSATGMVDAATRAALNAVSVSSASSVSSVASSAASSVSSAASSVSTVGGTEGLITTKLAATPANDANIRTSTNVPVWGLEVKAVGSDMVVDRTDLEVTVTPTGSSAQNPATFITGISAYDGDTLLMPKSLSSGDFYKDSSDKYHIIVSGIGFKVLKDTTKVLTFKINTVSIGSTDVARAFTIGGYSGNSQNIRAYDTLGLQSYTDMTINTAANKRSHTFNASGASTLTTAVNVAATPKSNNYKVSTSDGVQKLVMQAIDVKSTTGDSKVTKVIVTVNATTTTGLPSTVELLDGSTVIGSQSAPTTVGGTATFTSLSVAVPKDTTKTLTIRATFPTTVSGQSASTSLGATTDVVYEKPDGSTGNGGPSSTIAGNDQHFYSAVPQWSLVSASSVGTAGVIGVASSSVTATIVLKAHADGGSLTKPVVANFTFAFASTTAANGAYTSANSVSVTPTIQVSPTDSSVGDGGDYTVTLTGVIYSNNTSLASSQALFGAIADIDSTVGGITITNQTWGIDSFYTSPVQLTRGTF